MCDTGSDPALDIVQANNTINNLRSDLDDSNRLIDRLSRQIRQLNDSRGSDLARTQRTFEDLRAARVRIHQLEREVRALQRALEANRTTTTRN
jgi:peptidoglycan hydrolase CwlO-like protein